MPIGAHIDTMAPLVQMPHVEITSPTLGKSEAGADHDR